MLVKLQQGLMNKQLEKFARATLKEDLMWLEIHDTGCLTKFKRIYSHQNMDASISTIVDDMCVSKLDWAMTQVQNSIDKCIN